MTDAELMERAFALAWRGWGRVSPNPMVGAVVLDASGALAGEGWHAEFGGLHGERAALLAAGPRARGGTLIVSLEPCNHQGKQPPCTEAILAAGIARVVYALEDPNPEAAGGAEVLRGAGVVVEGGLLRSAAAAQNAPFLGRWRTPERPWVALKLATSLDGRIADRFGRSRWISGEPARDFVHWLRAGMDAIGVGGATARGGDHESAFDARDARQVAQAEGIIRHYEGRVKPILTQGDYPQIAKHWGRRVYYDQHGLITRKLGITQVPALVSQDGARLRIDEMLPEPLR